jgi:hypothetical protein
LKNKKIALYDLLTRDFPEFKDISGKLLFDKIIYDMLSEYHHCKILSNKYLDTDDRRKEYDTIKDELREEIRERIIRVMYSQC